MEKPTWVTVVGVLGIIFGALGLFSAGQTAMSPKIIQMQKKMMKSMQMPTQKPEQQAVDQAMKMIEQWIGNQPEWFDPVCIGLGVAALIVNGLYIYGAVTLLQLKSFAVKLFSWVLLFSIVLGIARAVVFTMVMPSMGLAIFFSGCAGVVLDIILIIVIMTGDKSAFKMSSQVHGT